MDRRYLEELIKNIQHMIKCPSCGASYRTNMISIIGGAGHTFLVHLECSLCGLPTMATVMFRREENIKSNNKDYFKDYFSEKFSELDFNKFEEKNNSSPMGFNIKDKIDIDDVLNMHQFLKDFDGDFESILSE